MTLKRTSALVFAVLFLLLSAWLFAPVRVDAVSIPDSQQIIDQGEYLVHDGGCISCHENPDDSSLSGGLALESEFGTFYVPNITPDPATGVGAWTGADFIAAIKHGRSPGGGFYYPAFPFRAYAGMTDQDALAIAAYLMSQPPQSNETPDHELTGWLFRWMMAGWNRLADLRQPTQVVFTDQRVQRGAYLADALGHCGECHTPRDSIGIPLSGEKFAGATLIGNEIESEIEAIDAQALSEWTEEDVAFFLFLGIKPDGEFVGGEMEAVIEHNTSKLTEEDRNALAAYLKRGQAGQE